MLRADPRYNDLLDAWTFVVTLSLCSIDRVGKPTETHSSHTTTSGVQVALQPLK